jgi:hypothetical protein
MQAQGSAMRRTALIGFVIGVALGCLFGAVTGLLPGHDEGRQNSSMSVNEVSGKPQLHIRGKPEIK